MSDISHHDPPLPSISTHASRHTTPPSPVSNCSSIGDGGQASQTTQTPSFTNSPRWSMSMGSTERALRPQSHRSNPSPRQLLNPPLMMLPDAIHLFGAVNMTQPPPILLHADYNDLFRYFAYELLSSLQWASTTAGTKYFYFSERRIPCDNIPQRDTGWYASLLYNNVHPGAPMRVLSPYQPIHLDLPPEIKTQDPMLDKPPVFPPPSTGCHLLLSKRRRPARNVQSGVHTVRQSRPSRLWHAPDSTTAAPCCTHKMDAAMTPSTTKATNPTSTMGVDAGQRCSLWWS